MSITQITKKDISNCHVQSVSGNRLTGTADENKKVFDNFPQFLAEKINSIISELAGTSGATNINTTNGTLQDVLDSYLASINDRYTKAAADAKITSETHSLVQNVEVDLTTGVITVTKKDGTSTTIDTALEKVPATFELTENDTTGTAILVVTNQDGSQSKADVSKLLNHYSFENTSTIQFNATKQSDGYHITALIPDASITMAKLDSAVTEYINNAKSAAALSETNAKTSETNAKTSETNAANSDAEAESWAVGGTGTRTGEDTDNAKYYSQQAKSSASGAESSASKATSHATSAAESAASAEQAYKDVLNIKELTDITEMKAQLDKKVNVSDISEWTTDELSEIVASAWSDSTSA